MKELHICPDEDLQSILDRADPGDVICLAPGQWRRKIVINTPGITLCGSNEGRSVISYGDYARKTDEAGVEYGTFKTYTVAVCADNVSIRSLTIENDALCPAVKGQEVALSVYGDNFHMEDCSLLSTQDTLFCGPLPRDLILRYAGFLPDQLRADRLLSQSFCRCLIAGSVDFIFGCGHALFTDCEIRSVYDGRDFGFAAAPAHSAEQEQGFTFRRCRFTRDDAVSCGSIFLARPWRDYGLARFEDCSYDSHIAPGGFDPWLDTGRDRTARFYETPAVPGRVPWVRA